MKPSRPSDERTEVLRLSSLLHEAREALERIRDFDHAPGCDVSEAPVYECGCYEESQWDIAKEALAKLSLPASPTQGKLRDAVVEAAYQYKDHDDRQGLFAALAALDAAEEQT